MALASGYAEKFVRRHLLAAVENHYHAQAQIKNLSVSVFPRIRIIGEGVVVRQSADVPAFVSIGKFTVDAGVLDLLRSQKCIQSIKLEGLEISIANLLREKNVEADAGKLLDFVIREIFADGAKVRFIAGDSQKEPLAVDFQSLHLRSTGTTAAMTFEAVLANAKLPGKIEANGSFGPWNEDNAGQSPLSGEYRLRDADLSTFDRLAGTLSAEGHFSGVLERIAVEGTADIRDFSALNRDRPVHVHLTHHAIVNGMNGDAILDSVTADFQGSKLLARGKVEGVPDKPGKTLSLTVEAKQARVEDILILAVKSGEPPLHGTANFTAKFVLPPGPIDVMDRLELEGSFLLEDTRFSDPSVRQKIAMLSDRARGGRNDDFALEETASDFYGHVFLNHGVARFTELSFGVPGAVVNLRGTFNLDSEELDFKGQLAMKAKLSDATSGVKSLLAKLAEPLFASKQTTTVVPIKITGTRSHPKFGLDFGQILNPR